MNNIGSRCGCCPRHCAVDRVASLGFCQAPLAPEVASVCVHGGEEPPLSGSRGVCNVFFAHCNLQCIYCQNLDISRAIVSPHKIFYHSIDEVVSRIETILPQCENIVGFVSPSHYIDSLPVIVQRLHDDGFFPTVVYNSNGYDDIDALRRIEPYVDVYLPDMKYQDPALALRLSHVADYPERAGDAILEMCRQKGSGLLCDEHGLAFRGLIVRHLVLPGHVDNSLRVLDWLADHLPLNLHVSLMAQYYPPEGSTLPPPLNRTLSPVEYQQVVSHYQSLGFYNGWVQELSSNETFRPHFESQNAFDNR